MLTLELKLTVTYEPHRVPPQLLKEVLENSVEHLIGNGGLTSGTEAEVAEWAVEVSRKD